MTGADKVGGLAGVGFDNFEIEDSYARGSVTASQTGGGLVGYWGRAGEIVRSDATGAVSAATVGGLLGGFNDEEYGFSLAANFWDVDTSGTDTDASPEGALGRSTAQMTLLSNYIGAGWDIGTTGTAVWQICGGVNDDYPFLSWEGLAESECAEPEPTTTTTEPTTSGPETTDPTPTSEPTTTTNPDFPGSLSPELPATGADATAFMLMLVLGLVAIGWMVLTIRSSISQRG